MGRIQEREAARKEKNALAELCKVQRKFMPDLFELFEKTADPRKGFRGFPSCFWQTASMPQRQ